ncbi:WD40-repeat-containing domain protein [Xylaria nigripes]|nr:WD40-repeat-containing domain protein [Xylaria nigripes]
MTSPAPNENTVLLSPPRQRSGKERKEPSITPRKFMRFFTPRSRVPSKPSPARRALRDLGSSRTNQRYQTPAPSSPLKPVFEEEPEDEGLVELESSRPLKRRRIQHTPESSPIRLLTRNASHGSEAGLLSPIRSLSSGQDIYELDEEHSDDDDDDDVSGPNYPPERLLPLANRGFAGQLAQRELGGRSRTGHAYISYPAADWRVDTADFCSRPEDVHNCISHEGSGQCIPFCTATCHRSGITAIGDEEGRVRLLDSSDESCDSFSKIHLSFTAHSNAIIDLHFSDDDYLLATASGDQTGQVMDMMTQSPVASLRQHTASLKQIRFQPGRANNSVLATSSRDGSVHIWDLRCSRPAQVIQTSEPRATGLSFRPPPPRRGCAVNSFYYAHVRTSRQVQQSEFIGPGDTTSGDTSFRDDAPSRGEIPSRSNDISVTAVQFLPAGREHLLLTACEADASIKLWDIRSIHSSRSKVPSSLSATAPPESHEHWRPFGISSLTLNTDASRLYALCKDNTVYAYSTAHLMLGVAPELACRNGEPPRRRLVSNTQHGLGPLYGFRHSSFHATSFYVKSAIRPARDGRSELLAVGSNDSCTVLFPTQERYFENELSGTMSNTSLHSSTVAATTGPANAKIGVRRPLFRNSSSTNLSARLNDNIPIIRIGTPLVRGHEREVGSVAWTNDGKLITVGDDYLIRSWGERREKAADLRTGGETGGRRWGCGWAEVGEDWDVAVDEE